MYRQRTFQPPCSRKKLKVPLLILLIVSLGLGTAGAALRATGTAMTDVNYKTGSQITQDLFALEESIAKLEEQVDSLTKVILQAW